MIHRGKEMMGECVVLNVPEEVRRRRRRSGWAIRGRYVGVPVGEE